jgi:hypothetical protein
MSRQEIRNVFAGLYGTDYVSCSCREASHSCDVTYPIFFKI